MNRVGEGNRQKKRRTEYLDLSAVVRIASETTAPGHKGGSDSELSGGLTDEEFDRSGTECKLLQIQHKFILISSSDYSWIFLFCRILCLRSMRNWRSNSIQLKGVLS